MPGRALTGSRTVRVRRMVRRRALTGRGQALMEVGELERSLIHFTQALDCHAQARYAPQSFSMKRGMQNNR